MEGRKIPITMATQHPDNASPPYWEKSGNGYINVYEELEECLSCYQDLKVDEFMWDWEGKYADEAVIDRLFFQHHDYFRNHNLGREKFLTFRLPNVWKEKGYSLLRALMVILTGEDFAHDLKFPTPPLFEVILPMTERPAQILYIQKCFQQLACFKGKIFDHRSSKHNNYLNVIPLLEGVENQINAGRFLRNYSREHQNYFHKRPSYLRIFLARSDPALVSGLVATVLANKIALSDIHGFSKESGIPVYPILGAGSLPFRGGLTPDTCGDFIKEYAGVRTVTVQSAFRYDYPFSKVRRAVQELSRCLPLAKPQEVSETDRRYLRSALEKSARYYRMTLAGIVGDLTPVFAAVPKRRERRLHIGFLAYQRKIRNLYLPRAINFTAAFYSLGIPPEFIGTGRALISLSSQELEAVRGHYCNLTADLVRAGRYLNRDNLQTLIRSNKDWLGIEKDISLVEKITGVKLGPKTSEEMFHKHLTAMTLLTRRKPGRLSELIAATGKIRRSLG